MAEKKPFYRSRGSGDRTLLCIHGAGCNSLHWMGVEPPRGWQMIAVDLPGHGNSQEEPYADIGRYAAWTHNFITELGGPVLVAGHSMGGAIALELARHYPHCLQGIALVCSGASFAVSPQVLDLCRLPDTTELNRFLAKYAYGRHVAKEQIMQWQQELGSPPPPVCLAGFTACSTFDFREHLAAIDLPTLVVSASQDRMTPTSDAELLAGRLPRAKWVEIAESGHMVTLEQPEPLAAVLNIFCNPIEE
jgi:pimeloyl-ACP methyl ester carboxylesterase